MIVAARAALRPARRPRRLAPADDLRPAVRVGSAVLAVAPDGLERLRHPPSRVHPDGRRHGLRDVADEHGSDERGRADQGRRRLGHPVDEPDGRRNLRRGGARRDGQPCSDDRRSTSCSQRIPSGERAHLAGSLGSGGALRGAPLQIVDASQQAFVYALQNGLRLGAAVALVGALLAWTLVGPPPGRRARRRSGACRSSPRRTRTRRPVRAARPRPKPCTPEDGRLLKDAALEKLGVRAGDKLLLIDPPSGWRVPDLPAGVTSATRGHRGAPRVARRGLHRLLLRAAPTARADPRARAADLSRRRGLDRVAAPRRRPRQRHSRARYSRGGAPAGAGRREGRGTRSRTGRDCGWSGGSSAAKPRKLPRGRIARGPYPRHARFQSTWQSTHNMYPTSAPSPASCRRRWPRG